MGLILLEALLALVLLVGIVWWTMFSGRKGGELPRQQPAEEADAAPGGAPAVTGTGTGTEPPPAAPASTWPPPPPSPPAAP